MRQRRALTEAPPDSPAAEAGVVDALAERVRRAYVPLALAGALPRRRWLAAKRALDLAALALASPLLLLALPFALAATLLAQVRLRRRPIVSCDCATRGGRVFRLRQLAPGDPDAERRAPTPDAWLSDSRLARWPALVSVLSGKLSLVGPAPWTLTAFAARPTSELVRLAVAPGVIRLRPVGRLRRLASTLSEAEARYVTAGSLWMDVDQLAGAVFLPWRRFP